MHKKQTGEAFTISESTAALLEIPEVAALDAEINIFREVAGYLGGAYAPVIAEVEISERHLRTARSIEIEAEDNGQNLTLRESQMIGNYKAAAAVSRQAAEEQRKIFMARNVSEVALFETSFGRIMGLLVTLSETEDSRLKPTRLFQYIADLVDHQTQQKLHGQPQFNDDGSRIMVLNGADRMTQRLGNVMQMFNGQQLNPKHEFWTEMKDVTNKCLMIQIRLGTVSR